MGFVTLLVHLVATRLVQPLASGPAVGRDGVFYQYIGLSGRLPYRDIWDIKPPLMHAVANGLGAVAGDPVTMHYLSVALMIAVATAAALTLSVATVDLTGSVTAGVLTGLSWLVFGTVVYLPARGLRPKTLVVLFGAGSLVALQRDRELVASVAAVLAAGFWQPAAGFYLVVLASIVMRRGRAAAKRSLGAAGVVTVVVISPYLQADAALAMVLQVLAAPFATPEPRGILDVIADSIDMLGYAGAVVILGYAGLASDVLDQRAALPWTAAAGWFTMQVLVLDFDGPPDLVVLYALLVVGAGIIYADLRNRRLSVLAGAALVLGTAAAVFSGPEPAAFEPTPRLVDGYWRQQSLGCYIVDTPDAHHYRQAVGDSLHECGPYDLADVRRLLFGD